VTAIQQIEEAQRAKFVDQDGESIRFELLPALSTDEIDSLQEKIGLALPQELRTLLAFCSGIDGNFPAALDFTGANMAFEAEEIFPNGLPIASDGFGNFWVLDITPETTQAAPVFFACHDAPVVLYQSADLSSFLAEIFRMNTPPHTSLLTAVHDDRVFQVWRRNPGVIDQPDAAASSDPSLQAFAATLPMHFQFIDLRNVSPGMGFSWGRYGPRTELRRHGYERIFAYARPPRTGFLARLFGRQKR